VAFEWAPLTGEFTVSAGGSLSLPIIGTVPAAGKTLEQISNIIGDQLQRQIGLQKRPSASVEISSYRPFFVTGIVTAPGKYSFIPGLTVVQALSMAGGTGNADATVMGVQREAIVSEGELRELGWQRLGLVARQARVEAVLNDQPTVVFPQIVTAHADQPIVARMMNDEKALFESRARSMKTELDALEQAKSLAIRQLQALKAKESLLAQQMDISTKDLNSINKLVSQGLTLSSRQVGASQNVADLESRSLDVSLAIVKTQQDLAKLDQQAADVQDKYKRDALIEAASLRDSLASIFEKSKTTQALLTNIETYAPTVLGPLAADNQTAFSLTISRQIDGKMTTLDVNDDDLVAPGDVLRVKRRSAAPNGELFMKQKDTQ
jgi:polysaccharide export outer membrane protein